MDEYRRLGLADSGEPTREMKLRFTGPGLDMLGWGIVYLLSYLAFAIPLAWWNRSYLRWMARKTVADDGSAFSFAGNPKDIWYWFPIWGILEFVKGRVDDPALKMFLGIATMVYSAFLGWQLVRWFARGLRLRETVGFRFAARTLPYMGWHILSDLSAFTIIGWPWVQVYFYRWIYRHMESEDAELTFVGKPVELLGLSMLFFVVPAVLFLAVAGVSPSDLYDLVLVYFHPSPGVNFDELIHQTFFHGGLIGLVILYGLISPWIMVWMWRWFMRNTKLVVKESALVEAAAPVMSE